MYTLQGRAYKERLHERPYSKMGQSFKYIIHIRRNIAIFTSKREGGREGGKEERTDFLFGFLERQHLRQALDSNMIVNGENGVQSFRKIGIT